MIFVKRPPVISITSIYVDGSSIPAKSSNVADYLNSNGYSFADSYISLFGYSFTRGLDNIRLVYQGGYNSVPPDIEQTCIELVGWTYREIDHLGHSSKVLAGETVNFDTSALSKRSKATLGRYKSPIPKT